MKPNYIYRVEIEIKKGSGRWSEARPPVKTKEEAERWRIFYLKKGYDSRVRESRA